MQQKFSKLLHEPLVWRSDGLFKASYTLYHDEQPIAHFRQESGIFKSDASIYLADADERCLSFGRKVSSTPEWMLNAVTLILKRQN